jgi:hypothetical protein
LQGQGALVGILLAELIRPRVKDKRMGGTTIGSTVRFMNSLVRIDRARIESHWPDIAFEADLVPYFGESIIALRQDLAFRVKLEISKLQIAREKLRNNLLVPGKAHAAVSEAVDLGQYQRPSDPSLSKAKDT